MLNRSGRPGVITTSSCVQHCLCEEPTQKRVDALHQAFNQVCEQNVLTWAGLYRRWTPGGAEASEPSPISFTLQLSLRYLLETAFKDIKIQYQARFTASFNLNIDYDAARDVREVYSYIYIKYSLFITFEKITLAPFFVEQLEIGKAARKAVGELDVILGWLQDAEQKSLS